MDSNNIDNNSQIIAPPPKEIWDMLVGNEKILYKAKVFGAYFMAFFAALAAIINIYGFINICSLSFFTTTEDKVFSVLILVFFATISFVCLRYSYCELRFFWGARYLATPTRLLIGIELPWEAPRTKVIVYWKDVAAICKSKRTYICLLNGDITVLRDRDLNFYENLYSIWQQSQSHSENMDSNSIDTDNELNIPSPKDIWKVLSGEKIRYKAKAEGAYLWPLVAGIYCVYLGVITIIAFLGLLLDSEETIKFKLVMILFDCLFATIPYFLLRYTSRELELHFSTYLATPTRLLIGIERSGNKPKTKVIVYWKYVTAIFKKKRTYICLSNDKRIMLREKEPNTYENLYIVWQQSRLHLENES